MIAEKSSLLQLEQDRLAHYKQFLGEPEGTSVRPNGFPLPLVSVHTFAPSEFNPFYALITNDYSNFRQNVIDRSLNLPRLEFMLLAEEPSPWMYNMLGFLCCMLYSKNFGILPGLALDFSLQSATSQQLDARVYFVRSYLPQDFSRFKVQDDDTEILMIATHDKVGLRKAFEEGNLMAPFEAHVIKPTPCIDADI